MKKIIFLIAVTVLLASVVICISKNLKNKEENTVSDIEVNTISDLTDLLGYDFTNSKISAIYSKQVENDTTCVCVVLEDSADSFMNDEFIKSTGFSGDNGNELYFSKLKSVYPEVFNMNYEQTNNHGFNMKDYKFKSFFSESTVPCSIYWFSAKIDNEEKLVIYAFLPFSVNVNNQ